MITDLILMITDICDHLCLIKLLINWQANSREVFLAYLGLFFHQVLGRLRLEILLELPLFSWQVRPIQEHQAEAHYGPHQHQMNQEKHPRYRAGRVKKPGYNRRDKGYQIDMKARLQP